MSFGRCSGLLLFLRTVSEYHYGDAFADLQVFVTVALGCINGFAVVCLCCFLLLASIVSWVGAIILPLSACSMSKLVLFKSWL